MNYPSELQEKMAAAQRNAAAGDSITGGGRIAGRGVKNDLGAMPQRDKSAVEVSMARLFERIGQLQAETDLLTDRLAPVSYMESTSGNAVSERPTSTCQMVETLDQASERIEASMMRLGDARARLCI